MSRVRSFAKYWLPLLLWMLLIFGASADAGSAQRSSRIIAPIVRWFRPEMTEVEVERIVFTVRKCAHFVEYAVLAVLLWNALWKPDWRQPRPWNWRVAGGILLLVALYAASDEIHQRFVPTRQGTVMDVVLDTSGAATGLLVMSFVYGKWRNRRQMRTVACAPDGLNPA